MQRLLRAGDRVFSARYQTNTGTEDRKSALESLKQCLQQITPRIAGVSPPMESSENQNQTQVVYRGVYHSDEISCGIFELTKGAVLPLHDHPGMTVFSKLIYGKLRCISYDILPLLRNELCMNNEDTMARETGRRARLNSDRIIDEQSDISILDSFHGNIHQLEALEDCAFIDIMGPPYDSVVRPCTYYKSPLQTAAETNIRSSKEADVWLAIDSHAEFHCINSDYCGEPIEGWQNI